jgi:uncharacterized protein (DUF58 family)
MKKPIPRVLLSAARNVAKYYPFTPAGTVVFAGAFYLLGASFTTLNPYFAVLAVFGFLILVALVLAGRLQAARFAGSGALWDAGTRFYAGRRGEAQGVLFAERRPFLFFRVHASVRGTVTVGRNADVAFQKSVASDDGGRLLVPLFFPFCGKVSLTGVVAVRDVFGLTRSRFAEPFHRTTDVAPAVFPDRQPLQLEAVEGSEERQRRSSSDEERYYQREYVPGDRFRDINWKASTRLAELFTRVSTVTQEKMKVITIVVRAVSHAGTESLDGVVHLNHMKRMLMTFLRTAKESNPEFTFNIVGGSEPFEIENEEDLDRFGTYLATLWFQSDLATGVDPQERGDHFIFSTPFDRDLGAYLGSVDASRCYLFSTNTEARGTHNEPRTYRLLPMVLPNAVPGLWALRRARKLPPLSVRESQVKHLEQEVLDVRLV